MQTHIAESYRIDGDRVCRRSTLLSFTEITANRLPRMFLIKRYSRSHSRTRRGRRLVVPADVGNVSEEGELAAHNMEVI